MNSTYTQPAAPPRRRVRAMIITSLAAVLVISAIIFATLPPLRRYIADPAGQPAVVGVNQVLVRGDSFQNHVYAPSVVQVPVGTTITWTFDDRGANGSGELVAHNVVGAGFVSPVLTNGTWSYTFDAPGTYRYVCTLHSYMDGQVEVVTQ